MIKKNIKIAFCLITFCFSFGFAQSGNQSDRSNTKKIGVLLPLTTKDQNQEIEGIANDIRDALNYATQEFNQYSQIKVSTIVIDTKQDTAMLTGFVSDLAADKNLIAIVGPIFSEEFMIAAKMANEKGVPIISPTATGNGIASRGEYIFQANPDFVTRARAMAFYSTKKLKYKTFACLAPNSGYGKNMVENFSKSILKNSANVFATEYYTNSADIRRAMNSLCKKIFEKGFETYISLTDENSKDNIQKLLKFGISRKIVDSLTKNYKEISIYSVLGRTAQEISKIIGLNTFTKPKYEVDLPVHSVDAFYLPIAFKNDIKSIYAALVSYKIDSKVLGTGDLNHILELDATKEKMNSILFDYDTYFDIKENAYKNFYKNFTAKIQKKISKYTLYGYDAYSLLLNGIKKGNVSRKDMRNYLSQVDKFPAIHSKISLKNNRINSEINILQYKNGKIFKVDEISVSE